VLNANEFKELQAESDPVNGTFDVVLADNGMELDPGSGSLKADIHMYEEGIPEIADKLDKIAEAVVENVNAVHSTGYGLEDGTTRNFFDPSDTTAGSISINPDILAEPNHIAASSVPGESGNNDIALQISDIKNLPVLDGDTLNNNTIEMLSRPGFRLSELEQNIESKESAMKMLVNQQQSESGVNIDEELSNLIKYQNAYQASAKVMNVGQSMYDTLLGLL
jgi:flagellar hook-associated protein 1 FlgK